MAPKSTHKRFNQRKEHGPVGGQRADDDDVVIAGVPDRLPACIHVLIMPGSE